MVVSSIGLVVAPPKIEWQYHIDAIRRLHDANLILQTKLSKRKFHFFTLKSSSFKEHELHIGADELLLLA
jgi:hypothetical protein